MKGFRLRFVLVFLALLPAGYVNATVNLPGQAVPAPATPTSVAVKSFVAAPPAAPVVVERIAALRHAICKFGDKTVPSVVCYGSAVLKKTTVTSSTQVEGPMQGIGVKLGSMLVDGSVDLHESTVNGAVEVAGLLKAHKVDFHGEMTVDSDAATLVDSTVVGSIRMSSATGAPHLKVECGSKITGSVTFVGKPGVVQITDDSDVQGKIHNGELQFIDMKCS